MKGQWKQNALLYFQNFDIIATGQFPISSKWPAEPIFAPVYSDGQIIVIFAIFSATTVFRNNIIFQFQLKTSGKEFYFSLIRSKIFEKNECVFIKSTFLQFYFTDILEQFSSWSLRSSSIGLKSRLKAVREVLKFSACFFKGRSDKLNTLTFNISHNF